MTARRMARIGGLFVVLATIVGCGGPVLEHDAEHQNPGLKAKPRPGVEYVAIIGDAYSVGARAQGTDPDAWPMVMTDVLREQGVFIKPTIAASQTSGYVHHGLGSEFFYDSVGRVVGKNQRLVILSGSARDVTVLPDSAKLTLWVGNTLAAARKAASRARIVVIGPAVMNYEPSPEVLQVRDIVKTQAEAAGTVFVDPIAERWFDHGTEMIRLQGDRPNAIGQTFIAERIAPLIASELRAATP